MSEPTSSPTATQVFAIPELLEMILLDSDMPAHNLFALQRVDKTFRDTIAGSRKCRRKMCLELPKDEVASENTPADTTTTDEANTAQAPIKKKSKKNKKKSPATETKLSANEAPTDQPWRILGFEAHKQGRRTLTRLSHSLPINLSIFKTNNKLNKNNSLDVRLPLSHLSSSTLKSLETDSILHSWKHIVIEGEDVPFQLTKKIEVQGDGLPLKLRVYVGNNLVDWNYVAGRSSMGGIVEGVRSMLRHLFPKGSGEDGSDEVHAALG